MINTNSDNNVLIIRFLKRLNLIPQMSFFRKIKDLLPKPFKFIQKQLDIQAQWQEFSSNLRPHRYKIYFILLVTLYPLYDPILQKYFTKFKQQMTQTAHKSLQPGKPTFQIGQNLIKNLLGSILSDQNVKNQGLGFVQKIIEDDKFVGQILQLLLSALKNQEFLKQVGSTSKGLILTQLKDNQLSTELNNFIIKIAASQQTKQAFINLIKEAFSSKQSVETIVNLLVKGVSATQVKQALSDTVNYSVRQLLADDQTISQIKIFFFFLLRKFQNDQEIKSMMDILLAKGVGLVKKNKKQSQLDKILKPQKTKPVDYL